MQIKNRQQLLMIVAGVAIGLLLSDPLIFSPLVKLWRSRSVRPGMMSARSRRVQSRRFIAYASFMTRPIAFDIRSHACASTASCRRPEVVSV